MENSCDLLIMNASVVIPKVGITTDTNIVIESGKIKSVTKSANNISATKKIDARGKYVLPGVIDPHVHYGVYTPINDAARTESRSAAVGGVTTMIRMLRLFDRYSQNKITEQLQASKDSHYIDYSIHASILRPDQVSDIPYLRELGITSLKIYMSLGGGELNRIHMDLAPGTYGARDGLVDMTDELMSSTVRQGASINSTILVHAENPQVCSEHMRIAKEKGMARLEAWSYSRPPYSEAQSIATISDLVRRSGSANLYFVHIGSTAAIDAILAQREKGRSNYYMETCPHYLTHTTAFGDLKGKVTPPIRSKSDVQSVWSALRNGIIDTVGTDHVANRLQMKIGKGDIWSALSGFPGVATMLPVLLSKGVNENRIDLERVAKVTSYNTARIFDMYPKKGTIQPGSDADLTLIDLDLEKTVTPDLLQSYSDYTIYDGWKLRGWPIMTIVRGNIVMEDGKVANEALGHGEFVPRPVVIS
jgi:dihydropyrimidinase